MNERINVTRSSMPSFEEYCNEIKELWNSRILTNNGIKHQKFQKELEKLFGCENVVLYTNGHLALEGILSAFEFSKGSEVITTPFTFASTTQAIIRSGLTPVFCDINITDYTIDYLKIEELITDKTVAILPVNVYGNVCEFDKIEKIATKHNLKVIYDSAHAFNEKYNDLSVANYGNASMFSFHATKVFNTIEGGAVVFRDKHIKEKLESKKNFGISQNGEVEYVGGNSKMSEFQASMGICNLRHLDEEILKRKRVYERYFLNLKNIKGIHLNKIKEGLISNYAYFPVRFDGYKYTRDEIFEKLKDKNIFARKYFYPLTSDFSFCKQYKSNQLNNAKLVANTILTLPMFADLPIEKVDDICNIILN